MSNEVLLVSVIVIACILLIICVVILTRTGRGDPTLRPILETSFSNLASSIGRSDLNVRQELSQGREEAMSTAKLLREEVSRAFEALTGSLRTRLAELANTQQVQLESFSTKLADSKSEAAENAKALREEVRNTLALLGEAVKTEVTQLATQQTEKLNAVTGQINTLTEGNERRQEALRLALETKLAELKAEAATNAKLLRDEVAANLKGLGETLVKSVNQISESQKERLDLVSAAVTQSTQQSNEQQEALRKIVEGRLDLLRTENTEKLELMRQTVDEKLQGTLEQRLGASFKMVNEQLEQVHKSVGEMQSLATGVGDLKRVLTNVRSRGIWGEVSLGNLLEQVLAPDQFERNVEVQPRSNQRVEYAIRLPGEGNDPVWLPIDAKFPAEDYDRLVDAAERGDVEAIEAASRAVEVRIRASGREICDKYIHPPHTTDFAVLFLPTEGLFAEVIRRPGLVDLLQRDCRIVVTGPTTLLALLNSLRMGFRTLAIQKRSSEVWQVLAAVKTEFSKYGAVMDKVQKKLQEAQNVVEDVAKRRRAVDRKLRGVEGVPELEAAALLEIGIDGGETAEDDLVHEAVTPE